jgi:hypothetical protein
LRSGRGESASIESSAVSPPSRPCRRSAAPAHCQRRVG